MIWRPRAVNVKDFGAKGDRVTDDTAAIEAAFAAASRRRFRRLRVVKFDPGVYVYKGDTLDGSVRIRGAQPRGWFGRLIGWRP